MLPSLQGHKFIKRKGYILQIQKVSKSLASEVQQLLKTFALYKSLNKVRIINQHYSNFKISCLEEKAKQGIYYYVVENGSNLCERCVLK